MSAYGWTIAEINELTYPQIKALMPYITENPPTHILLKALIQAFAGSKYASEKDSSLMINSKLKHMGDHVAFKEVKSKIRDTVKSMVVKKTGKKLK